MDKKEIKQKINTGWIRINMIFEMIGSPKNHVEDTLKAYIANIKTDTQVTVLKEEVAEPEEISKGLWSTFVEADMLVEGLEKLTWLCFNFMPASIEVIEPDDYHYKANMLQNWINDLLSKLHEVGALTKQFTSETQMMKKGMNQIIKNFMLYCIRTGADTPKAMEDNIGIPYDQLKPFFEALMKEGKLSVDKEPLKATKKPAKKSSKKPAKKKTTKKK